MKPTIRNKKLPCVGCGGKEGIFKMFARDRTLVHFICPMCGTVGERKPAGSLALPISITRPAPEGEHR
jgi:hypothetical protein